MRWESLQLFNNPWLRIVLTCFVLASSFTLGIMFSIGIGMMPLIHKGELVLFLGFYGSVASVLFTLIRHRYQTVYLVWKKKALDQERSKYIIITLIVSFLAFLSLIVLSVLLTFSVIHFDITIAIFAGSLIVISAVRYLNLLVKDSALDGVYASLFAIIGLLTAFQAGQNYVTQLREHGPQVAVMFVDSTESRIATFLFPAFDGYIVLYEGSDQTHYIPSQSIRTVVASPTNVGGLKDFFKLLSPPR